MKALIINGSPKRNGNTINLAKRMMVDINFDLVQRRDLVDLNINHCKGCLYCKNEGKCIMKDDMDMLIQNILDADTIILVSPIYFNGVTSITKTFIDRLQRVYMQRFVLKTLPKEESGKKGVFIGSAGSKERKNEFDGARKTLDLFFKSLGIKNYHLEIFEDLDQVGANETPINHKKLKRYIGTQED